MNPSALLPILAGLLPAAACIASPRLPSEWTPLPALPDPLGFAGSYAGVSHGALVVAGGANFPDRPPWEHGTKTWYDIVYVLPHPNGAWQIAGRLPRPAGYGLSISVDDGVLLIGGGDARENFRDVVRLRWDGRQVKFDSLPTLPIPLAMSAGALVGRTIFVAGGLDRPDAARAQAIFLSLDLDALQPGWRRLEPWPGPERFLATGGALDGSFYLFSGAQLVPAAAGGVERNWLRDAWRFTPGSGWKRLADLPTPLVASPAPAPSLGSNRLLLIGGDDGALVSHPPQTHPGFPRDLWAYDANSDTWSRVGALPFSLVTTTAVRWRGRIVIPGGEARPGVRSNAVWIGAPGGLRPDS
jgi:N-acetylneuraminic acid mutarotase